MRYIHSLFFLRVIFISFISAFFYKAYKEYHWEATLDQLKDEPILDWDSVDLEAPPSLNDSHAEILRLNELLAHYQYNCKEPIHIGDDFESFVLCGEKGDIGSALVITGNSLSSGKFEKDINVSQWTVFIPEESFLVDQLTGDVEVNYLTELKQWNHWMTWEIETAIKGRLYGIAKIDLYTFHFKSYDQPEIIGRLVKNMTAKHLAITIDIGSAGDDAITEVMGRWYRLLYWLFFSEGYALIGATSAGICKPHAHNCKYRVSMVRMEGDELLIRKAPVFGLGSPWEEKKRLLKYISKTSDCTIVESKDFPKFCSRQLDGVVVMIRYRPFHSTVIPTILMHLNEFHLITPLAVNRLELPHIHHYGIARGPEQETIDGQWKVKRLGPLFSSIFNSSTIDLFIIDMEGGEWDILPQVLKEIRKRRIEQIVIHGRIWTEENENYRQFYWYLWQLENYGYKRAFGYTQSTLYDIAFVRIK